MQTVQIIFNCFRQRPAEVFFARAQKKGGNSGARAAGQRAADRQASYATPHSPADDHRNFNRQGHSTWARHFQEWTTRSACGGGRNPQAVPPASPMSQFALRWILMFDAVTCAIPGGKRSEQVADNCQPPIFPRSRRRQWPAVRRIYDAKIRHWCSIAGEISGGVRFAAVNCRETSVRMGA